MYFTSRRVLIRCWLHCSRSYASSTCLLPFLSCHHLIQPWGSLFLPYFEHPASNQEAEEGEQTRISGEVPFSTVYGSTYVRNSGPWYCSTVPTTPYHSLWVLGETLHLSHFTLFYCKHCASYASVHTTHRDVTHTSIHYI